MIAPHPPVDLPRPPPLWLRTRPGDGGEDGTERDSDVAVQERRRDDRLYCAACRAWVTREAWRIAVDEAHAHTFTNPAGFTFDIG